MITPEGYREVPIEDVKPGTRVLVAVEPEPEVIWEERTYCRYYKHRVTADGIIQQKSLTDATCDWVDTRNTFSGAMRELAQEFASLYARNKANEEKLREIKKKAVICDDPKHYRRDGYDDGGELVQLCREIEL